MKETGPSAGIWSEGDGLLADHAVFPAELAAAGGHVCDTEAVTCRRLSVTEMCYFEGR